MAIAAFIKDPDAVLDFSIIWTTWLAAEEEALATSVWAVSPSGLTVESTSADLATGITTIWVSGGVAGTSYTLANKITTATRTDERTIKIRVIER